MEHSDLYLGLSEELAGEIGKIAQLVGQATLNSTRGETAVLVALHRANGPLTPGELASKGMVTSARIANILRALEEKGWAERRHSTQDRRTVEVSLTEAGRDEALRRHDGALRRVAVVLSDLGERDARELVRLIGSTRGSVERLSGEAAR